MECKVKIGSAYEPKWFERRYTQGTYSAKNIPPCEETAWLQQAMLGRTFKQRNIGKMLFVAVGVVVLCVLSFI